MKTVFGSKKSKIALMALYLSSLNTTATAQDTPVFHPGDAGESKGAHKVKRTETPAEPQEKNLAPVENKTFDTVLTDLLNEFAYDLKTGQVSGLKQLAIRKITLNDAIPKSYESYLESMVGEKIHNHSKIKLIQCPSCRSKKTIVENGNLKIIVPINHPVELDALANHFGIEAWMDVGLMYQETNMVLAFNIFDSKTKELLWSKVYNSESIYRKKESARVAEQNKKEALEAQNGNDNSKESVFSITTGYQMAPNVKKTSGMAALSLYGAERLADGHIELGALVTGIVDPNKIISTYSNVSGDPVATGEASEATSTATIKPFEWGASLFVTYQVNFFEGVENVKSTRTGISFGGGLIWAPGYAAFTARGGGTLRMGKRFTLMGGVLYSIPTTVTIRENVTFKTKGGVGGDIGLGFSF